MQNPEPSAARERGSAGRRGAIVVAAVLLVLAAGCATSTAPERWQPGAEEVMRDPYGSWTTIEFGGDDELSRSVSGELIAVSTDSLYILDGRVLRAIALEYVSKASAHSYRPYRGSMTAAVILGTLSTISNGYYLVFTAPAWMIVGSAATGYHTHEPIVRYPDRPLSTLREYARFPQGLPNGLDRSGIAPRAGDFEVKQLEKSDSYWDR